MMQSAYLCVIFHVKHKNDHFLQFQPDLLVMSQASSSATTHKIQLILLRRSKTFHQRQKCFEILEHIKNCREGLHHPPPPLYHSGGMNLCVRLRVKMYKVLICIIHVLCGTEFLWVLIFVIFVIFPVICTNKFQMFTIHVHSYCCSIVLVFKTNSVKNR